MFGVGQRVAVGNVKVIVVDVVQKHIDTGEVIDGEVDFLSKEPLLHIVFAEDLDEFEQQRAGTAGRVIDLVHLFIVDGCHFGKKFAYFLRGEKFAAGLARISGVHGHQLLIGVAKGVDGVVVVVSQLKVADGIKKLHRLLISFFHRIAELVGIDIEIIKQAFEVIFAVRSFG